MKKTLGILVLIVLAPLLTAQENPLSDHSRVAYRYMQLMLHASAERMPAEHFDFKPADSVRTYAELLGHIAESQYLFCSAATGEKNPAPEIEGVKASKAEVLAALQSATAYCQTAYGAMTDAKGMEMVRLMRRDMAKLSVLNVNLIHTAQHYGNVMTYLRIKGLVPPSSDPDVMKQLQGE